MVFYVGVCVLGIIYMLAAINNWEWIIRGGFLPGVSWEAKRYLYFAMGLIGTIIATTRIIFA